MNTHARVLRGRGPEREGRGMAKRVVVALLVVGRAWAASVDAPPPHTNSWIELRVFKDAALTQEASGTAGGDLYPAIYVHLGAGEKCTDTTTTVRIRDEHPLHNGDESAQMDTEVSLTSGTWEQLVNGTWGSSAGPASGDNQLGETEQVFRSSFSWLSESQPKGHNGRHSVKLLNPVHFAAWADNVWGEAYAATTRNLTVEIGNLLITKVVTNAGNADYALFDPSSDNEDLVKPKVTVEFADAFGGPWAIIVFFRETTEQNTYVDVATMWTDELAQPGRETLTFDPADTAHCSGELPEWHTYAVDVYVLDENPDNPEEVHQKEPYDLQVIDHHVRFEDSGMLADYRLHDFRTPARDASELKITVLDESFGRVGGKDDAPTAVDADRRDVPLGDEPDVERWIAVWTGADSHSDLHRNHTPKRMAPVNEDADGRILHVEVDSMPATTTHSRNPLEIGESYLQFAFRDSEDYWVDQGLHVYSYNGCVTLDFGSGARPKKHRTPLQWRQTIPDTGYLNLTSDQRYNLSYWFEHNESNHTPEGPHYTSSIDLGFFDARRQITWNSFPVARWVHLVGAAHMAEASGASGISNLYNRWSYVFATSLYEHLAADPNLHDDLADFKGCKGKVAIHEIGHQFFRYENQHKWAVGSGDEAAGGEAAQTVQARDAESDAEGACFAHHSPWVDSLERHGWIHDIQSEWGLYVGRHLCPGLGDHGPWSHYQCVMRKPQRLGWRANAFCPHHAKRIRDTNFAAWKNDSWEGVTSYPGEDVTNRHTNNRDEPAAAVSEAE